MTRLILLILALALASTQAFSPSSVRPSQDTALRMGLFDALMPKKSEGDNKKGGMDADVFGGRGAKITVREDEDNAMWVEDNSKGKKKGKKGK